MARRPENGPKYRMSRPRDGRQHPGGDLHSYGRALLEAYSRTAAADALAVLDDRSTGRGPTDR